MKRTLIFLISLFSAALFAAEVTLSIMPSRPSAGTVTRLKVSSQTAVPEVESVPKIDGIAWEGYVSQSSSTQIINGKRTQESSAILTFTPEKEGEYVIPPFEVTVDGQKQQTKEFRFRVAGIPSGASAEDAKGQDCFAVMSIPGRQKNQKIYVGEELPLDFFVYIRQGQPYSVDFSAYPAFTTGKDSVQVFFHDYRKKDPRRPNFESIEQGRQTIKEETYLTVHFRTRFRALSAGKLEISGQCGLRFSQNDWGFFATPVGGRTLKAALPDGLTVQNLPLLPADAPAFCGLTGSWNLSGELNQTQAKTGDPLTLKIRITGDGTLETFTAPELNLPGFRVYPPEIKKEDSGNGCTVSYTLLPVAEGKQEIRFAVSVFDTETGSYKPFLFRREVNIEKSAPLVNAAPRTFVDASGTVPEAEAEKTNEKIQDILYLKKNIGSQVRIPLWKNKILYIFLLPAASAAVLFFCIGLTFRDMLYNANPALRRRKLAAAQKKNVLNTIRNAKPENLSAVSGPLSEYLNNALNLPPGASLSDAADAIGTDAKTQPFRSALQTLANASWMPELAKSFTPEMKQDLLKGMTKFLSFACLFLVLPLSAASTQEEALHAYDNGNFKDALQFYANELNQNPRQVSPAVLYNMGNCYYQLGDLARAMVCYERANKLAPRDSDIQENLNLVRRKLLLPEKFTVEHPSHLLVWFRDLLRLDEWLLAGTAALCICFFGFGFLSIRKKYWKSVLGIGLLLFLASAAAMAFQYAVHYAGDNAVTIRRNTPVYALPSEANGRPVQHLREGTEVDVEEIRLGWARIRSGSEEGWVREQDLLPMWNPEMSDLSGEIMLE